MIRVIAHKELKEMLRDGRFRVAATIVFALLVAALFVGWNHYRTVNAERAAAQARSREQWENQTAKNPHSAAHFSVFAFKPVAPLALADTGVNPYAGIAVWLEAHRQNELKYSAARDTTSAGRFGQLTAAFVLQVLVPLVIILLAFGALASEREQGTLRQVLSLGIARGRFIAGKFIGIAAGLSVLLIPAAIVGAAAIALASEGVSLAASVPRVALLAIVYVCYFAVFLGVTLAVSALVSSSRVALIVLLAFWSLNIILPRVVTDIGKGVYPTPSALEFQAAVERNMREGIDGHNPYDERGEKLKQQVLAQYGVQTVEELPVNFDGIALQVGEDYETQIYERHFAELRRSYQQQNWAHTAAGIIAPLAWLRSISMSLAGSDWAHHLHFAESAEAYRRFIVKRMNDEVTYNSVSREYDKNVRGRELYAQVPDFQYQSPPLTWSLDTQTLALALLVTWSIAAVFALVWATRRMKVDSREA